MLIEKIVRETLSDGDATLRAASRPVALISPGRRGRVSRLQKRALRRVAERNSERTRVIVILNADGTTGLDFSVLN